MKMKHLIPILIFSTITSISNAQLGMDNHWYLGSSCCAPLFGGTSINFFNGTPVVDTSARKNAFGWCSSLISDSSGNLLFYNDTKRIYDRNDSVMENGDTLINCSYVYSLLQTDKGGGGPQASIILPPINSDNIYYLFSLTSEDDYAPAINPSRLYMAKIDMSLNNGLGKVISKWEPVIAKGKLEWYVNAVKHGNGRDWWLTTHSMLGDTFYTLLLTPQGLQGPFVQKIGWQHQFGGANCAQGIQTFSRDGAKYVCTVNANINLFDFDRCTGLLSNWKEKKFSIGPNGGGSGLPAFSANGKVLYLSRGTVVEQYNLDAPNWKTTRDTVAILDSIVFDSCDYEYFAWPHLASDDKIYITAGGFCQRNIHVIDSPDSIGQKCNVLQNHIILPKFHHSTFPNAPNYRLGPLLGSACDSLGLATNDSPLPQRVSLYPNPAKNSITINCPFKVPWQLIIYDNLGKQCILKEMPNDTKYMIDIRSLKEGLYQLCMLSDKGQFNSKFAVVK